MSTTIMGYSDDIIDVEGDVDDELHPSFTHPQGMLVCSDGTVLSFEYNGDWVFQCQHAGLLFDRIDHDGYSDIVKFKDGLKFVTLNNKEYQ